MVILFGLLGIWVSLNPPDNITILWALVLFTYLGIVVVIDLEHKLILHIISAAGLVIGLIFGNVYNGLANTLIGGAAGFGIMLLFYLFGGLFLKLLNKIRGSDITEIPLGYGDVNLAGIIGLILGFPGILTGLVVAIFSAGAVSLIYLILALFRGLDTSNLVIPYGPFITLGIWIGILF